ncbi:condensin complex subunit SMC2 [Rhizopogon vinicolor AM-OR11-026]|uniref:Structural maintenance of chromosomes protein n=1 Tax=Rhizopogon vinicolor AM-OR11-026 TaxID=1314800 RepID=A0A1B7N3G9_9AGAM|nr:condensin complex subunit SMC2 [Rhizopogon vinicolor AM-OR11-026]
MRIEELVLEGFKSYPVRTQITGWDSSFNAITGLNGSGKSNILDAICFVLGITNMSQMRAQNQQDLIYKRGQAGITKASVTIVFDNSDREKSPLGFETFKQITVTRQIALPNISKYLLNGHKSQQNIIQTLFQSVQLNINNPNFLIMQGRITKVLNMRPQEILGMVEEAAGTRMFEERKDKAKKTMEKKEKRVHEITSLLEEEITPKLDKLREEKRHFLTFQKARTELEKIGRKLRAWEWTAANKRAEKVEVDIKHRRDEMEVIEKRKKKLIKETKAAEKEKEEVNAKREAERKKGGKFKKMEEEVAALDKELVKVRTQVDLASGNIADEDKQVASSEAELEELRQSLEERRNQAQGLESSYVSVKAKHTDTQAALSKSEELLQTLLTGLSSSNTGNSGGGYMGQLADARARMAQGSAEEEQNRVKLNMSEKELKALEAKWKDVEKEAGQGKRNLENMRTEAEELKRRVADSGWSTEREQESQISLATAKGQVRQFTEARDAVKQRLSSLTFEYSMPYANFDRTKVKGLVANLTSISPQHHNKSQALEIAAGGKLYNVVVEDEKVGKDLLQNGKLKKRVTIIPLNKINAFALTAQKLAQVEHLAPGKANLALSLIGYPEDVARAMAFVFGDTIICEDAEAANAVTFGAKVRSVTLNGDMYDPSGTLSGGAAPSGSGTLLRVQELLEAERRLGEAQSHLHDLERAEAANREKRESWKKLTRELDIKQHEVNLLEQQAEGSSVVRLGLEVEQLKKTIADLGSAVQAAKDKQTTAKEECQKLEKDMDEFKNNKEGKINELKAEINKQKAALQKQAVVVKTQQKEHQTAVLELEQMEKDIKEAEDNIKGAHAQIVKLHKDLAALKAKLAKHEADYAKAEQKLLEERATLTQFDNELKDLEDAICEQKRGVTDAEVQLTKLEHEIAALEKDKVAQVKFVTDLEKQHEWIQEECQSFGKPGSQYEFDRDMPSLRAKADELEEKQKGMKKKVNPKVMNMIDTVEKKETDLKKMLATVLKDKEKIEETIEELDRYKRDALEKTWEKVSGDFGAIFAELLPQNFAKLQPPEGQDLMHGLEVKVQLGTVWKQSLTELSGGQRSLIALSLIMALLQFKPAPMYILDEIDAALDLSHTQHIGQLFKNRFKGSQFIVVSLKEGLFTNANVLYRTRFRDGTSVVERTVGRSGSTLYSNA